MAYHLNFTKPWEYDLHLKGEITTLLARIDALKREYPEYFLPNGRLFPVAGMDEWIKNNILYVPATFLVPFDTVIGTTSHVRDYLYNPRPDAMIPDGAIVFNDYEPVIATQAAYDWLLALADDALTNEMIPTENWVQENSLDILQFGTTQIISVGALIGLITAVVGTAAAIVMMPVIIAGGLLYIAITIAGVRLVFKPEALEAVEEAGVLDKPYTRTALQTMDYYTSVIESTNGIITSLLNPVLPLPVSLACIPQPIYFSLNDNEGNLLNNNTIYFTGTSPESPFDGNINLTTSNGNWVVEFGTSESSEHLTVYDRYGTSDATISINSDGTQGTYRLDFYLESVKLTELTIVVN